MLRASSAAFHTLHVMQVRTASFDEKEQEVVQNDSTDVSMCQYARDHDFTYVHSEDTKPL